VNQVVRPTPLSLGFVLALGVSGCGPRVGTVSGKVTYQAKPLPGGYVTFISQAAGNATVSAPIQEDGSYSAANVPAGPAKVTVQGPSSSTVWVNQGPNRKPVQVGREPPVKIPARYGSVNETGLSLQVAGGQQQFNIPLE
jgi:hypothetical protein